MAYGIIYAKSAQGCGFKSPALGAGVVEVYGVLGRKKLQMSIIQETI